MEAMIIHTAMSQTGAPVFQGPGTSPANHRTSTGNAEHRASIQA